MGPPFKYLRCRSPVVEPAAPAAGLRIAIADDHPLMRAALAGALATLAHDVQFVEAANLAATLALLDASPSPDLLLMDLHMPGAQGIEGVREVRERAPEVPLAVVSADDDPAAVKLLLALGVSGFIPKTDSPAIIVSAVRLILAGGVYVPPRLVADAPRPATTNGAASVGLTARQMDVVRLLARGLSNKAIARELGVSEGTVKVHLLAVFRALDVRNRTAAVLEAQRFLG
jgi:DNA-binding NarL/FixJ family response regulator